MLLYLCVATGDMYQHFEITTPGVSVLQEATDKALDHATGTATVGGSSHHRQQPPSGHYKDSSKPPSTKFGSSKGVADTETGQEMFGGLTDWQELLQQLDDRTWSGWFSMVAGKLRLINMQEGLSQREVSF